MQSKLVKHLFELIPHSLTTAFNKELKQVVEGKTKSSPLCARKIILIKKNNKTKTIKLVRPVSLITTFNKVISDALSTRLNYACTFDNLIPDSIIA